MATQNKLQRLEAEVVSSTQLIETSDVVMSLAVLDDEERRHDDNAQLFHQIRRPATAPALGVALVDIDLHEASLGMHGGQLGKVGVENVANSGGRAVEVHHDPLGLLGHVEELPRGIGPVLPLPDGAVNAVALGEPLGLLLGRLLHLGQPTFADAVQLRIGRLEELTSSPPGRPPPAPAFGPRWPWRRHRRPLDSMSHTRGPSSCLCCSPCFARLLYLLRTSTT